MNIKVGWIIICSVTGDIEKTNKHVYKSKAIAKAALSYKKDMKTYCVAPLYVNTDDIPNYLTWKDKHKYQHDVKKAG